MMNGFFKYTTILAAFVPFCTMVAQADDNKKVDLTLVQQAWHGGYFSLRHKLYSETENKGILTYNKPSKLVSNQNNGLKLNYIANFDSSTLGAAAGYRHVAGNGFFFGLEAEGEFSILDLCTYIDREKEKDEITAIDSEILFKLKLKELDDKLGALSPGAAPKKPVAPTAPKVVPPFNANDPKYLPPSSKELVTSHYDKNKLVVEESARRQAQKEKDKAAFDNYKKELKEYENKNEAYKIALGIYNEKVKDYQTKEANYNSAQAKLGEEKEKLTKRFTLDRYDMIDKVTATRSYKSADVAFAGAYGILGYAAKRWAFYVFSGNVAGLGKFSLAAQTIEKRSKHDTDPKPEGYIEGARKTEYSYLSDSVDIYYLGGSVGFGASYSLTRKLFLEGRYKFTVLQGNAKPKYFKYNENPTKREHALYVGLGYKF